MIQKSLRMSYSTLGIALVLWGGLAIAQDYPSKPVRLVVANTPGSIGDLTARIIAPEMSKNLGQPIVVENKPGANFIIGYEYVAKSPADGYTLATVTVESLPILAVTSNNLRFDPLKDLPPFIGLIEGRLVAGSSTQLPWKSFDEMSAYIKANPGKMNSGTSSPASRLPLEALVRGKGLNLVHIPYSATGPYIQAINSAEIALGLITETQAIALGDKFRVLAISGGQRAQGYPAVPTFRELGLGQIPGFSFSLNVPAGAPEAVVNKLHSAASRALLQPDVRAQYTKLKLEILNQTPEAAVRKLADQGKFFADIAKQIGLQPE